MNLQSLANEKLLILDGGMGTMLMRAGLTAAERPEAWNLTHPRRIEAIHAEYLDAGADIITTNTFGANELHFPQDLPAIIASAVSSAKSAVHKAGHGWVALDVGPTGRLMEPYGDLPFTQAVSLFENAAALGARAGADLIIIETMTDAYEMKAAVLGAKAAGLPVIASFTPSLSGRLMTGADIPGTVALLEGLGVHAVGINCGFGPEHLTPFVHTLLNCASVPVLLSPNAGLPQTTESGVYYTVTPERFGEDMKPLMQSGLSLAGGCCGTTPAHIRTLAEAARGIRPPPVRQKETYIITSGRRTLRYDAAVHQVGRGIHASVNKKICDALKAGDMETLVSEAETQAEDGADILDINVYVPGMDEASVLETAVREIQAVCTLPLQLNASKPESLEAAMRIYNGRPLIRAAYDLPSLCNGLFPLIRQYGGLAVLPRAALTAEMPSERIRQEAARKGIRRQDILIQ